MKRSEVFDLYAVDYDKYRPGYPVELREAITERMATTNSFSALEIGSGSGQATQLFTASNCSITCVEPSGKLIELARRKLAQHTQVSYINKTLEEVSDPLPQFDLIFAGQSFHWVDDGNGYERVANLLKPDGLAALFWNSVMFGETEVEFDLFKIRQEVLNSDIGVSKWNEMVSDVHAKDFETFTNSQQFTDTELLTFDWKRVLTAEQYCGLEATYSNVYMLADGIKSLLFNRYTQAIENHGGTVTMYYRTQAYLGKKRH